MKATTAKAREIIIHRPKAVSRTAMRRCQRERLAPSVFIQRRIWHTPPRTRTNPI